MEPQRTTQKRDSISRIFAFTINLSIVESMKAHFIILAGLFATTQTQADTDYSSFFSDNGSFELNQETAIVFGYPAPHLGNPTFTDRSVLGWSLHRETPSGGLLSSRHAAADGERYLRLQTWSGSGRNRTYAETFAPDATPPGELHHTPFTVGDLYEMSFWAAGDSNGSNGLDVHITFPQQQGTSFHFDLPNSPAPENGIVPSLEWLEYSFQFVAEAETMRLSMVASFNTQNPGLLNIAYVDNFQLRQVPEPGSALLVAASGVLLFCIRRRRSHQEKISQNGRKILSPNVRRDHSIWISG